MRKTLLLLLSCFVLVTSVNSVHSIYADDCDSVCNGDDANRAECNVCKEKNAKARIAEIEQEILKANSNLKEANELAIKYGDRIDELEAQINELQPEIDALQIRIDELTLSIEENNKKVEKINQRVLARMENSQKTMHFNPFIDFLLGSQGFADFLRRSYGVTTITNKEEDDKNDLIDIINQLNSDKEECDEAKYQLEEKKKEIEAKRQEAAVMKSFYDKTVDEINRQLDELMDQEAEQQMILSSIVYNIEDLLVMPRQTGFIKAIPGASISAGMPYYPSSFGGGAHTGVDYAARYGTPILAPADGVIISSVNACTLDTGNHLGDKCGYVAGKGMSSGGNQIRMMFSVNGIVYGLIGFHMAYNSVHAEGVVTAGTQIGAVGSSGNSTGAHCHIELFYLGKGENADIPKYLNAGYTVGFSIPYNISTICKNKGSAPCRLDPRMHFGNDPASLVFDLAK